MKWYVVWVGTEPGVCSSWADCEERVKGFPGARYKAFDSQLEAVEAYRAGLPDEGLLRVVARGPKAYVNYAALPGIVQDSIAVDGACSGNPGRMEYRGVDVPTGAELFHQGPFEHASNNIGEFLALVHALALLVKQGNTHTAVYSDSRTALAWLRNRRANTKIQPNEANARVFDLLQRAQRWVQTHTWPNAVLKWDTEQWGEIPADFGRK